MSFISFPQAIESDIQFSGAPFLDEKLGKEFIDKLWTEIVEEAKAIDPELKIVVEA